MFLDDLIEEAEEKYCKECECCEYPKCREELKWFETYLIKAYEMGRTECLKNSEESLLKEVKKLIK